METLVFLCNGDAKYNSEIGTIDNKQLPNLIKKVISTGEYYRITWSCWNSKFIQIGDRAYLQRSGNIGTEPTGFIAAGHVIAAPISKQLKLLGSKYSNLSEAYIDDVYDCFFVSIQLDSVVDFDSPLEQKYLSKLPQFQKVNFNFGRGGARFDARAAAYLDAEWEKHSLIQQRKGRGRRLVDVFFERGEEHKQKKDYQAAINSYQLALEIDPKYSKAINRIQTCKSALQRNIISIQQPSSEPRQNSSNGSNEIDRLFRVREELDKQSFFSYENKVKAQRETLVSIARRQGQSKFRQVLLEAYAYKCAITDFDAEAALEAAHIIPYIETENNHPSNGLLLRADLHTLFDLNLIAINPETMQIFLSPMLQISEYRMLQGKQIRIPKNEIYRPNRQFLQQRFEQFYWYK